MKRILSYLLVAILLLNVFGYYGIFVGLRYQNDKQIALLFDQDQYNKQEEVTIQVPLSIPYMNETQFERVSGEFEYQGEFYRLVKQKLANDTLTIVCVKNEMDKRINRALSSYVKTFADHASTEKNHSISLPSFIKDFLPTEISLELAQSGWTNTLRFKSLHQATMDFATAVTSPPPQA